MADALATTVPAPRRPLPRHRPFRSGCASSGQIPPLRLAAAGPI